MRAIRYTIENGQRQASAVDVDLARSDGLEDRSAYVVSEHSLLDLRAHSGSAGLIEIAFGDVVSGGNRADRVRSIRLHGNVPFYLDAYHKTGTVANGVTKTLARVCKPLDQGGKPGLKAFVVAIGNTLFQELEQEWRSAEQRPGGIFAAADPRIEERAQNLLSYMEPISQEDERRASRRFLGGSAACELARRMAVLSAKKDANTLITGETGTGKGVLAKIIHELSERPGKFVVCNCAAISPELFELLFCGNEKDFPNPRTPPTKGYMREADKGTLLLDEIGDLIPSHQAKLLRIIEDKVVKPLGSDEEIPVDVRILSATDQGLLDDSSGRVPRFREQLYERLKQLSVHAPPLRSHLHDIPELAQAFWSTMPEAAGKALTPDILRMLQLHGWPRNVRELEGFLTHLAHYINPSSMEEITRQYLVRGRVETLVTSSVPPRQHVDLSAMIDVLAKASHETWLEAERALGCEHGEKRVDDGDVRTSPHFMEFDKLDDEMKSKSRNEASAILQALLEHGFVIRKVELDG